MERASSRVAPEAAAGATDRTPPIQHLLSLPSAMAGAFTALLGLQPPEWYAASDPEGLRLGSAGGTVHLLVEAWRATGPEGSFWQWLRRGRKLVIHGGGQSRRLPAYAAVGKPFVPVPVLRRSWGQRLDQTLLDFQLPEYRRVLEKAPAQYVVLVTSGDVLLRFCEDLGALPHADVLAFGMPVLPEIAQHFGVFFTQGNQRSEVAFFLQKPSVGRIRELAEDHPFLVDTGMWLLSERAVEALLRRCGWREGEQGFAGGLPVHYELYARFGLSLGTDPVERDPDIGDLHCAVVPLAEPEFYHLGTSRQLIESISQLQNRGSREGDFGPVNLRPHPDQYVQNALVGPRVDEGANHTLWIENATIPSTWSLAREHVLTGVPDNAWNLALEPGICLDFVPVGERDVCVRAYGIDDLFSGDMADAATQWLGRPALSWFAARGVTPEEAGIAGAMDIQEAPLFPCLAPEPLDPRFVKWLFAAMPETEPAWTRLWIGARRLSAQALCREINVHRLYAQRDRNRQRILPVLQANHRASVFYRLDLQATAHLAAPSPLQPDLPEGQAADLLKRMRDQMFRAVVLREQGQAHWTDHESAAFGWLRKSLVDEERLKARPSRQVLEDQIVWGRSPVRLDLAGGWTDTPPYCLQHGGRVVNLAADLNGQPPIQVFARPCERRELVIRSIDLGVEERVATFEELDTYARPGSEFALAKAAFAQAGFLPRFHAGGDLRSLGDLLNDFGGGIELSMLAAVPAGSGLGTSSILASTLLAVLSDLCGLGWDSHELVGRTLALEQMLTTGGGWQDPAGGIFRGIKMVESGPGPTQELTIRWLPEHLFSEGGAKGRMLLYYTGLTRLAKNILQEIVRGMFLNSAPILRHLEGIGRNAETAFHAIQRNDYDGLCASVLRSWELNQRLDAGTNPPAVQAVWDRVHDLVAAGKLLGAGGGGYLLLMAKDETAARRIREELTEDPPNGRARFVDFAVSGTGLQVTRS